MKWSHLFSMSPYFSVFIVQVLCVILRTLLQTFIITGYDVENGALFSSSTLAQKGQSHTCEWTELDSESWNKGLSLLVSTSGEGFICIITNFFLSHNFDVT